ncbi:putative MATE family efflux protein [Salisediminibacterium halotolerans]|nr:putative MATE family efflux protein [Actinophytocola xinjiangensis]RPE86998.1 putative MATE family efflux protein [Salisediminibacterium halotolerans]TWG32269.1 putative MATE family efflux protein [Salisediminibacterium halotolerans]GEL07992.1 putative multidrug resistance protein YpnP [Salisediminibacterium halotolerans]
MQSAAYDFTNGSIMRKMVLFSAPIFLTNILQTSYQVVDSLWVGNLLGPNALGAIAISGTVVFTILSFIIGINTAALTVLSQHRGAKDEAGLKRALNAFVVTLGLLTLLMGIVGVVISEQVLIWMGTPDEILPLAALYLRINFIGIIFLFGYNFIATVLRALGDSKTPVRFVTLALLLNTVLDPLFISGFDWGIAGAAYATIVSQGTAFLYGLIFSVKKAGVPFSIPFLPRLEQLRRIFKLGLPSGLSMMVISGGVLAIMTVVTGFGEEVVAGFGAAQRLDSLIMLPALTLGSAINSMAGQNIGADLWPRVREITKSGLLLIAIVSGTVSTLVFIFAETLVGMFVQDPETIAFGTMYVQTVAFFYPFLGINFVLNGVIRAAGAMFQVFVLNVISFWVLRFPLTYIAAMYFGEAGIGIGMAASLVLSSLIAMLYYRFGGWRNIDIMGEEKA